MSYRLAVEGLAGAALTLAFTGVALAETWDMPLAWLPKTMVMVNLEAWHAYRAM